MATFAPGGLHRGKWQGATTPGNIRDQDDHNVFGRAMTASPQLRTAAQVTVLVREYQRLRGHARRSFMNM